MSFRSFSIFSYIPYVLSSPLASVGVAVGISACIHDVVSSPWESDCIPFSVPSPLVSVGIDVGISFSASSPLVFADIPTNIPVHVF
jgi:hypothetical protein